MGYACPVCETPQADAGHLANHLAFTALLRGGEHETWLDEHAPEWESLQEPALGERVVEHARSVEYPQVFEDTTDHQHTGEGHIDDKSAHTAGAPGATSGPDSIASLLDGVDFSALRSDEAVDDEELDEIIAHAKALTEQRHADADGRADSETD